MGDELQFGTDLSLDHGAAARGAVALTVVHRGDAVGVDGTVALHDLVSVSGRDNLCQAIWLRLATPEGDLAHLGHGEFGSRLYLLLGRLGNPQTLALADAYVRRALRREPRVARISQLRVSLDATSPGSLLIELSLLPADGSASLDLEISVPTSDSPVE